MKSQASKTTKSQASKTTNLQDNTVIVGRKRIVEYLKHCGSASLSELINSSRSTIRGEGVIETMRQHGELVCISNSFPRKFKLGSVASLNDLNHLPGSVGKTQKDHRTSAPNQKTGAKRTFRNVPLRQSEEGCSLPLPQGGQNARAQKAVISHFENNSDQWFSLRELEEDEENLYNLEGVVKRLLQKGVIKRRQGQNGAILFRSNKENNEA